MAAICGIVTAAIFQLIIGFAATGYAGYIVYSLAEVNRKSDGNLFLIAFQSLWVSIITFGVTTLFSGIIGCVAGCQRGQCVVLTYLVSCVLDCLSSCEVLIISAYFMAFSCTDGVEECTKSEAGIFWIVVLACSAFMFLISLIGSGFACRARCYCCSSPGDDMGDHEPDVMILTTTPTAPPMSQINTIY